jgi:hypothetical protein
MTSCEVIETALSCEEALLVAEPFFLAVQEKFVEWEMGVYGSSKSRKVRLECDASLHMEEGSIGGGPAFRHFAACSEGGDLIVMAPELVELPEVTLLGIMAHEFGHALDFSRPVYFGFDGERLVHRDPASLSDKRRVAAARWWRDRSPDVVEGMADQIAEVATGRRIGYTGPCMLQTLAGGPRRPARLR